MPVILDLTDDQEGIVASHATVSFRKVLKNVSEDYIRQENLGQKFLTKIYDISQPEI